MRYLILILPFLIPLGVSAASFTLSSDSSTVGTDTIVLVSLSLDTEGVTTNAFAGAIVLPETLSFEGVRYDDSLVSLWVEEPKERESGIVSFSGLFTSGFNSEGSLTESEGNLATLVLRGSREGVGNIRFSTETDAYADDGRGSELSAGLGTLSITVVAGAPGEAFPEDTTAPEPFALERVSGEPFMIPGDVLVFTTNDKGSGIKTYEVAHAFLLLPNSFLSWNTVESPLPLTLLDEIRILRIRAVDYAGNVEYTERIGLGWYGIATSVILILLFLLTRRLVTRGMMRK